MQPHNLYIDHPPQVPIHIACLPPDLYPPCYALAPPHPDLDNFAITAAGPPENQLFAPACSQTSQQPPHSVNNGIPHADKVAIKAPKLGGLSCLSRDKFTVGHLVAICIPQVCASFIAITRVRWRRRQPDGYQLGLDFLDPGQAFQIRMLEQTFYISLYRQHIAQEEGRHLSDNEAAQEWIRRYGAAFPASANG